MAVDESEDRISGDSRLGLDALLTLAAHEGATLVLWDRDGEGLGLRVSYQAARLVAEHMSSADGLGLGDVLRYWARRATDGRPSLVFVVTTHEPFGCVVIDRKGRIVRVRREDEADEEVG